MFEKIDSYISRHTLISRGELELFHSYLIERKVKKGSFILVRGDVCRFMAYIQEGCLKKYHLDERGEEIIIEFAIEDEWVGDIGSFLTQISSDLYIEALEDTKLILIDYIRNEQLCAQIRSIEIIFKRIVQKAYADLEKRFYSHRAHSAEQRYANFIKDYPLINQRVSQSQIAFYIGITPESLSRIKASLCRKIS